MTEYWSRAEADKKKCGEGGRRLLGGAKRGWEKAYNEEKERGGLEEEEEGYLAADASFLYFCLLRDVRALCLGESLGVKIRGNDKLLDLLANAVVLLCYHRYGILAFFTMNPPPSPE